MSRPNNLYRGGSSVQQIIIKQFPWIVGGSRVQSISHQFQFQHGHMTVIIREGRCHLYCQDLKVVQNVKLSSCNFLLTRLFIKKSELILQVICGSVEQGLSLLTSCAFDIFILFSIKTNRLLAKRVHNQDQMLLIFRLKDIVMTRWGNGQCML